MTVRTVYQASASTVSPNIAFGDARLAPKRMAVTEVYEGPCEDNLFSLWLAAGKRYHYDLLAEHVSIGDAVRWVATGVLG